MDRATWAVQGGRQAFRLGHTGLFYGTGMTAGGTALIGTAVPSWTGAPTTGVPTVVILLLCLSLLMVAFHRATEWSAVRLPERGRAELVSRRYGLVIAMSAVGVVLALRGRSSLSGAGPADEIMVSCVAALAAYVVAVPPAQWIHSRLARAGSGSAAGAGGGWRPLAQAADLVLGGVVAAALLITIGSAGVRVAWAPIVAGVAALVVALAGAWSLGRLRAGPAPATVPKRGMASAASSGRWAFPVTVVVLSAVAMTPEVVYEVGMVRLGRLHGDGSAGIFDAFLVYAWTLFGALALGALLVLAAVFVRTVRSRPRPARGAALLTRPAALLAALSMLVLVPGAGGVEGAALTAVYLSVTLAGTVLAAKLGPARPPAPAEPRTEGFGVSPAAVIAVDLVVLGVVQALAWLRWPLPESTAVGALTEGVLRPAGPAPAVGCLAVGLAGAAVLFLLGRRSREAIVRGTEA